MRKACIFILIFLLICVGCQPTPEAPFVIGKDNGQMIEKAQETREPEKAGGNLYEALGCPKTYVIDIRNDAARVHIQGEAKVILPETEGLPLVYVQAARFDQERVYAFFRALTGGVEMYDIPTATPKAVIEKRIRAAQAELDELVIARGEDDFRVQFKRDEIASLQKAYQDAPETVSLTINDGTLKPYDMTFLGKNRGTATAVDAISDPFGDDAGRWFAVNNDADYADAGSYTFIDQDGNEQYFTPHSGSNLMYAARSGVMVGTYSGGTILADATEASLTGEPAAFPEDCTILGYLEPEVLRLSLTPADVRRQAEQLMTACGVTDMFVDGVYLLSDRQEIYGAEYWDPADLAELRAKPEHQVYAVRFLRRVAGVPVESFFGMSQVKVDDSGYGPEWQYEVLEVAVDDGGIQAVHWTGPLAIEEVVTDRAALLPFEDVRSIFEKMLPVVYANYGADRDWDIEISEVRLCLWRIFDKNSFTRGILVPAWCFYGAVDGRPATNFQPLLIVNGVDGSVIDPLQGY